MLFPTGRWPFLALALVALTWLCRWLAFKRLTVTTGVDVPIFIILLMALVGYSISVEPALSQTRLWSLILGIVVFYGLVNTLRSEKHIWIASSFLAFLTVGIAGISLLGTDWQQTRLIEASWIYDRLPTLIRGLPNSGVPRASDLIQPRFVGITMGVLVAVFLALLSFSSHRNLRLLSLVVIIVGLVTLLLTQTLAGLAGVLVAVLFLAVWRNRWFLLAVPFGLAGGLASLLATGPTRVIQYLLSVDNPVGIAVALRLDIWSRALAMIRDMPYTGIGLNTFPVIQTNFYPGFILGPAPHAHNLFIQTALDLGLPGLAAFLYLLVAWTFLVWSKYRSTENREYRILLLGLIAGVLSYVVAGSIDAMMLGAKPSVAFWILLGMGAAPMRSLNSLESANPVAPLRYLRSFLHLAFMIEIPLASALINPAALYMNIGAIQAHQALYPAHSPGSPVFYTMEKAKATLIDLLSLDTGYLSAYELLGRIYAWEGTPAMAMEAFAHRVALDGQDPLLHYFPSDRWLRQIQGTDGAEAENWDDLLQVYSHWMNRFPHRAEIYTEIGLVWQCFQQNPDQADRILRLGIEKQATPVGLLEYYQGQLAQGDISLCIQK